MQEFGYIFMCRHEHDSHVATNLKSIQSILSDKLRSLFQQQITGSDSLLDHPPIVALVMLSFIFFALISVVCNIKTIDSLAASAVVQSDQLQQKLKQLASKKAVIVLDGDNIRGKSRFKLSKEGLTIP